MKDVQRRMYQRGWWSKSHMGSMPLVGLHEMTACRMHPFHHLLNVRELLRRAGDDLVEPMVVAPIPDNRSSVGTAHSGLLFLKVMKDVQARLWHPQALKYVPNHAALFSARLSEQADEEVQNSTRPSSA